MSAFAANLDLATLWAFVIAFAVFLYVVLDGFDLGIGILFPVFAVGEERDQAMNAIAPVWDGNETWLVLGGGALMAAFPLGFAILMPALYPLIVAMLLGLVFRGVAFEFRFRDERHRHFWDFGFTAGSLVAALAQGITLGAVLQGVKVSGRAYAGGWLDWLTPFSLLTGASVVVAYALLACCFLIWKTEGGTQEHAFRLAKPFGLATLAAISAVSLATPFLAHDYYSRWFHWPGLVACAVVPLALLILSVLFARALAAKREAQPFAIAVAVFALTFAGLGISIYPYLVPASVTIWQAAAPEKSQVFMGVGAAVMIPLILGYTIWSYWVFRGKAGTEGYH